MAGDWLQTIEFDEACKFIDALRPTNHRWSGNDSLTSGWLFRGMSNSNWGLQPSAWRQGHSEVHEFISSSERFKNLLFTWRDVSNPPMPLDPQKRAEWNTLPKDVREERVHRFVKQHVFEMHFLNDFWVMANEVGHPVEMPEWIKLRFGWSAIIGSSFTSHIEPFFAQPLVATVQHHGIPTRLLDWTMNPLVAAFFAAENATNGDFVVWAVRRRGVKRTRLKEYHIPRHSLPFLHAQAGCFIWDPWPYDDFARNGEWPSQDDVFSRNLGNYGNVEMPVAYKLVLPASEATKVIEMLWKERISKAHLMPTFDSVASTMLDSFSWRHHDSLLD